MKKLLLVVLGLAALGAAAYLIQSRRGAAE